MRSIRSSPWMFVGFALLFAVLFSLFFGLDIQNAKLILLELRLPRLILGLGVGAALASSGVMMQTLFSNPIAEPYTLGLASGSALGAAIGASSFKFMTDIGMGLGAALGALMVILIIFSALRSTPNQTENVLLIGVLTSFFFGSVLAIYLALSDPSGVQDIHFWLLGDLSRTTLKGAVPFLLLVISVIFVLFKNARNLDAFLFGEGLVESFGVSSKKVRMRVIVLVSVLVGMSVSLAGVIGFIGLVTPHLIRKFFNTSRHEVVLPMTAAWGAIALVLCDSIGREVGSPRELPVGAITATIGAPICLFFYLKKGGVFWSASRD